MRSATRWIEAALKDPSLPLLHFEDWELGQWALVQNVAQRLPRSRYYGAEDPLRALAQVLRYPLEPVFLEAAALYGLPEYYWGGGEALLALLEHPGATPLTRALVLLRLPSVEPSHMHRGCCRKPHRCKLSNALQAVSQGDPIRLLRHLGGSTTELADLYVEVTALPPDILDAWCTLVRDALGAPEAPRPTLAQARTLLEVARRL